MTRSRKKANPKSPMRDTYESSGEIGGRAVVVQGPEAHVDITQRDATPSEIRRLTELAELDLLHRTIATKLENIRKQQLSLSFEKGHNPYRFGQALSFRESNLLAGRQAVIGNVLGI
jgi:hypothetical protein